MDKTVDYDFLIKKFCGLVIKHLYARRVLGTDYRHDVAVTIARFRVFERDPEANITKDGLEKHFSDFYGLKEPISNPDVYGVDNSEFGCVIDILWDIKDYYSDKSNKYYQDKLKRDIREYLVNVSPDFVDNIYYRVMPMTKIVSRLQKQK